MPIAAIDKDCRSRMEKTIDFLKDELRGVRTGRAHAGLVEHVRIEVESYGSTMQLRELASITVPDPGTLLVKPFDPTTIKDIEKGLQTSDVGIPPSSDGKVIRLSIPALSGERRQQLIQHVKKQAEEQKIAIRNIRREANKAVDVEEKAKSISEDQAKDAKDDVQKLVKKYESQIDELLSTKTAEIETI